MFLRLVFLLPLLPSRCLSSVLFVEFFQLFLSSIARFDLGSLHPLLIDLGRFFWLLVSNLDEGVECRLHFSSLLRHRRLINLSTLDGSEYERSACFLGCHSAVD